MFSLEIQEIQKQFNKVITYSQGIENPKTDKLFEQWLTNKRDIIEAFNGKLIYEYPERISLELGEKEKKDRIIHFIDSVVNTWGCYELADFIDKQSDGFFSNITVEDFTTNSGKTIKKGTKLVKSFKYFIPESRRLEDIQNEASRIIQEDKIEGTFCLSVHPLDFLSSSETTYNWRSCHSLDGDYRAGNLSYIMDKSTIVCYLKGDKDEKLPRFPQDVFWNSKKWRVLLFLSDNWDMIFAGRQYPFETTFGLDFILNTVLPKTNLLGEVRPKVKKFDWKENILTPGIVWSKWNKVEPLTMYEGEYSLNLPLYVTLKNGLKPLRDLITDVQGSRHYNDLLYSSCYKPLYCFKCRQNWRGEKIPVTSMEKTHFSIGAYTYCLRCGENEVLDECGTMMCDECELNYGSSESDLFSYCDCCGSRFYTDEGQIVGEEFFCSDCCDKYTRECEWCGMLVRDEDIIYDEKCEKYFCPECFEDKED